MAGKLSRIIGSQHAILDERWGEAVKVYIVLLDGQTATEQEILDYCDARMARYKVPRQAMQRAS